MLLGGPAIRRHTVPTDDASVRQGEELRITVGNVAAHELAHRLDRRRLDERQIETLARDDIESGMEALDQSLADRDDVDGHGQAAPTERSSFFFVILAAGTARCDCG